MPAKRTSKKAAAEAPVAPDVKADEPAAAGDAEPADVAPADEQFERPLNRAERRAKAKGKVAPQTPSRTPVIRGGSRGPAPSPRQWANRRSG